MIFARPVRMTDALRNATARRVLPLAFSSREIADNLPAQIRNRSIFSARNIYASQLAESAALIGRMVQPDVILQADGTLRRAEKGESLSHVKVRSLMRRHLERVGYLAPEGREGTLTDLASNARINLVINTQTAMCRQYGRHRTRQAPAILQAFPADKLYRALFRKKERIWRERWNNAKVRTPGTKATVATSANGPFIAPANDPIWTAISRFGNPYPPFDYRSGMRTRGVLASEAARHGITETPVPEADPLDKAFAVPLRKDMPPAMLDAVRKAYGSQAMIAGNELHIVPPAAPTVQWLIDKSETTMHATAAIKFLSAAERGAIKAASATDLPETATLKMTASNIRHTRQRHGDPVAERATYGRDAITPADIARVPDVIASPEAVWKASAKEDLPPRVDNAVTCQAGDLTMVFSLSGHKRTGNITLYTMRKGKQ
jgi:hypothetical protein